MRKLILATFMLASCASVNAQTQTHNLGTCFSNANRKSIINKMDNFMARVSEETGCPKDKLAYTVDEYYTVFYSKQCRHLPKRITFDACGEKRTYLHNGLSGAVLYWLLGSWVLDKK